jgi:hypothetical protein
MKGILRVLSSRGDDEYAWEDRKSTAAAKKVFDDLIAKHHAAFAKKDDGHERIKEFDPNAKEIIMVKPLVGG